MQSSSQIIDNLEQNIWEVIKDNLSKSESVRFAVWYLFLSWLKDISSKLKDLNEIKILIWNKTDKSTSNFLSWLLEKDDLQTPAEKEKIKKEAWDDYKNDIWKEFKQTENDKDFLNILYDLVKDENRFQIKIYTKWTFHAKAYIFWAWEKSMTKWQCIIGSSNLSKSGFYDNTELNVVVDWNDNYDKMTNWFNRLWEESEDFNKNLLDIIDNSWLKLEPTPYEVYMKVLYELVWEYVDNKHWKHDWMDTLFQFQIDAVYQSVWIVKKYGGVFLSDVVWLWKTYTGWIILHLLTRESHSKGLIIAPAWLKDNWQDAIDKFWVNANIISQDSLDKVIDDKNYDKFKYVLVDESHKFKDKNSNRYVKLQEFIHKTNKKLILLSATPLNLNWWDIYNQIKLFHIWEETKLPITPNHLYQFFKDYEKWKTDISDIMKELMVRRTRIQIKTDYSEDLKKNNLAFPERVWPEIIHYDITKDYLSVYSEIEEVLWKRNPYWDLTRKDKKKLKETLTREEIKDIEWQLNYAIYFKTSYLIDSCFEEDEYWNKKINDPEFYDLIWIWDNLKELAKIMFFMRIESSPDAFINTLNRILEYNKLFLNNLEKWIILKTKHSDELLKFNTLLNELDEDDDYFDLIKEWESFSSHKFHIDKYKKDIKEDIKSLEKLKNKASILEEIENIKIDKLKDLLNSHNDKKILVFTQFSDTANYLWKKIQIDSNQNIEVLTWKEKSKLTNILWRFSPISQNFKLKEWEKQIDVLVATDVIAEWQNAQDASVVINYDLHWNPVKLIQRIWRIDRIWSVNDKIYIYNFSPSNTWESKIWMEAKVSDRIKEIHKHIWEESKILTQEEKLNKKMLKLFEEMNNWKKDAYEKIENLNEENNKLFTYSSFIKELKDLKNNDKELFNKIKKLPLRIRTAKWWDEKKTLVFCKNWIHEYFYIGTWIWNIINSKSEFLKLLKSDIDDKIKKLPENHDIITNDIENYFYDEMSKIDINEEFSKEKKIEMDIAWLRNKIIKYKEEILTKYDLDLQEKCDDIVSFLWNKMEAYEKRKFKEFKKVRKPEEFNEDIINDMYEVIVNIKELKIFNKTEKKEKDEKVIVISESIV